MTTLVLPEAIARAMYQAALDAAPCEACGLLGGSGNEVRRLYTLTNADRSQVHYRMLPAEQFAAVRDMRARGLEMVAIWHSHPNAPAGLSAEDLRLAFTPDVAYVTVSLAATGPTAIRAFLVVDGVPRNIEVTSAHEDE